MPQYAKKIIKYLNFENRIFIKGVYEYDEPVLYRYAFDYTSRLLSMPKGSNFNPDESIWVKFQLFDEHNVLKLTENVGEYGIVYVELEPKKYLESIYVEPDDVVVDIFYSRNEALIYEFYNPSKFNTINIQAKQADDTDNVYDKIKNHKDDLEFRLYYIRQALKKPGTTSIDKPKAEFQDWLTAKELAEYLKISIKTVYNKTSSKEFKSYPNRGKKKYKKSDFD